MAKSVFIAFFCAVVFFNHRLPAQIQASFSMDENQGCPPLTVNFTNTTPGGISGLYQWDFGDGDTSSAFSPVHTYQAAGNYLVTLNGMGTDGWPLIPALDSVNVNGVAITAIPEICLVTVDSASAKNIIVWEKPSDQNIAAVNIYRESGGAWVLAGTVPQSSLSRFIDADMTVDPVNSSYTYKISFADTCGNESGLSAFHHTMHLVAYTMTPSADINLTWVDYSGFSFNSYRILRDTAGTGNFILIDSVAAGTVNYVDSNPPAGSKYLVEIEHPSGCTATKAVENHNSSRSNKTFSAPPGAIGELPGLESAILITPNPSNGKFRLLANEALIGGEIEIYDVLGKVVYKSAFSSGNSYDFDIGNRGGIYFIRLISEGKIFSGKVMIE